MTAIVLSPSGWNLDEEMDDNLVDIGGKEGRVKEMQILERISIALLLRVGIRTS